MIAPGANEPARLTVDEPIFFVVESVRYGSDLTTIEGIFTKREDAESMIAEIKSNSRVRHVLPRPYQMPMSQIVDRLTSARLGAIAKLLAPWCGNRTPRRGEMS